MANTTEEEVQEALWNGSIPVKVEVEDDVLEREAELPPLFLQAPRQAPVGAIQEQVLQHISDVLPPGSLGLTFWDRNGVHLKSNYPLGVLYDLMEIEETPWRLVVKCITEPEGDDAKDQFFNALKASSYAATGSSQHVITMPTVERQKLWAACGSGNRQEYEGAAVGFHNKMEHAQRFLVRVFCRRNERMTSSSGNWWKEHIESKLKMVVRSDEGSMETRQVLGKWLREDADLEMARVIVAGITCPLETSLEQLWRLLRAPDFVLYIVVRWT
eukprot:scaffold44_cov339-Pavlova_lutheri.AAC.13